MAWGIGPGDAVLVPSFTFVATAEVVSLVGATPVFMDVVEDTFNLDAGSLEAAIGEAIRQKLHPRVVIPVDLFGQPADYERIVPVARAHGLKVLADTAQSFGARLNGRATGTFGDATGTSFFPAKPLGCYGDGGAVFTEDEALIGALRSLRVHGQGRDKYDNVRIGMNGRLDTMQAAVLLQKLEIFADELDARMRIARRYNDALADVAKVPRLMQGATSSWAQYTIRVPERDRIASELKQQGIPTAVYYPIPLHRQTAYQHFPAAPGGLPVSDRLAAEVLSLPMHPYLDEETQDRIIDATRKAAG
jgi:dTDP-4-amino-4,6-dideoxygalactose transaminase